MARYVVAEPDDNDWVDDETAGKEQKDCEVPDSDLDGKHVEEDDVSDCGNDAAQDYEAIAVFELVAEKRGRQGTDERDCIDRNGHHLCLDCGPSKLSQDGRDEQGTRISRRGDSNIHKDARECQSRIQ